MPKHINHYTIKELCNENQMIIISDGNIEIRIEPLDNGIELYLYCGGKIIKNGNRYLVTKKPEIIKQWVRKVEELLL